MDEKEAADFNDATINMLAPKQLKGMQFRIQTSVLDCLGCGNCVDVCPGKKGEKALKMVPFNVDDENMKKEVANWEYLVKNVKSKQSLVDLSSSSLAHALVAVRLLMSSSSLNSSVTVR